ncbi:MAG: hypothetical protein QM503_15765 [Bacteroidota bacterium]
MDYNRIELLLHKYLDGNSTVTEEKELNIFFAENDNIPEKLLFAKDLFSYFNDEKSYKYTKIFEPKMHLSNNKYFYFTGIAASLLVGLFLLFSNNNTENKVIYAYVDGKAITDIAIAEKYTKQILYSATKNIDKGTESLYYAGQFTNPISLIKN